MAIRRHRCPHQSCKCLVTWSRLFYRLQGPASNTNRDQLRVFLFCFVLRLRLFCQRGHDRTSHYLPLGTSLAAESTGRIFFSTSSMGPGRWAIFSLRSSASLALFSLICAACSEGSACVSGEHTQRIIRRGEHLPASPLLRQADSLPQTQPGLTNSCQPLRHTAHLVPAGCKPI